MHCAGKQGCKKDACGCRPKRRRAPRKRQGREVEVVRPSVHTFTPVYIQSGQAPIIPETNPLLQAVQRVENKLAEAPIQYYKNELRHRVTNYDKGHITSGSQTEFKDDIPVETPSAKKLDDDFDLADLYDRGSVSEPDIRGENPLRRQRSSGNMSESNVGEIRRQPGRGRQPDFTRKEDESDVQYEHRMERNRKAREKRGNN